MRKELEYIERIENYILGKLSKEETSQIEKEINENPQFKADIENQKLVMQAVKRKALKVDIKKANPSAGGSSFMKWGLSIVVVAAISSILLLNSGNYAEVSQDNIPVKEELVSQAETIIEDADTITKDTTSVKKLDEIFEYKRAKEESSKSKEIPKEDFTFNGLKTWVEPDINKFIVNSENGATIEGKDGILVIIPEDAFINSDGEVVTGNIDFEFIEALTMDDIILYNLTTTSDGKALETGGMFYTNATQNGEQLKINPERPLYVEIPTEHKKDGMMAFEGEVTPDGNINWKNPKELNKFLVKVDFKNLDFLPDGFEERVRAEPKDSPFYVESKDDIDEIYYSLSFSSPEENELMKESNEKNIKYKGKFIEVQVDIGHDDTFISQINYEICRGINPLTIKTIRTEQFSNTFLATKEFEERINFLHSLENGEECIQLYIENLSKDMWEVDKMVQEKLPDGYSGEYQYFIDQKHTNLKDAEIYQKQLSAYYNQKKAEEKKALAEKNKTELAKLNQELVRLRKEAEIKFDENLENKIKNTVTKTSNISNVTASNTNVYATQWYTFGWANIDAYLKLLDNNNKEVKIIAKTNRKNVRIYQYLNTINTLTPIMMNNNTGISVFPDRFSKYANKMNNTTAIAISHIENNYAWGNTSFNPYKSDEVTINIESISLDELKSNLRALNVNAEPLIKKIKSIQETIEKQQKLAEKQAEMQKQRLQFVGDYTKGIQSEVNKKRNELNYKNMTTNSLRQICFGCPVLEDKIQVVPNLWE